MTVKCDWLDVTYSPLDTPERDVLDVLQAAGAECQVSEDGASVWSVGRGTFILQCRSGFHRYSASGAVLDHLRACGRYMDFLSALSGSPHNVTRLDAAHDVLSDAPPIIAKLRKRYPQECCLSRKSLRTKSILETRPDGLESGTWYVGHQSRGRITAKVYDKQLQMLSRFHEDIPPTTRYELTFKRDIGTTLRDAAEPSRLFWSHASPVLLKRPAGIPDWVSGWGGGWHYAKPEIALAGLLKHRIESSSELKSILALADRADCMEFCSQLLAKIVEGYTREHEPEARPAWQPSPEMVAYAKKLPTKRVVEWLARGAPSRGGFLAVTSSPSPLLAVRKCC